MKYIFLTMLAGFVCFTSSAQFIFTPKKLIETNKESVDKYESIRLKDSISFSAIRIIDSRYDTTGIGFYLDGYLALKDSSQPLALQHIIDKYYQSLYTPGKDTLIIRLEKLNIQDAVIRDTAFIYTAGSVSCRQYIGRNNSYKYYSAVDTMLNEKYGYETTYKAHKNGKHYNNEFWDYYLLRLLEATIKVPATAQDSLLNDTKKYFPAEEIKQEGLQKRNKPILAADSLKAGFYRNFSEFVNNAPTFLYENNENLKKLLEVMHYRVGKNISNETPDTSYWGYCDGKNLYIRYQYDFYQLERKDCGFYIAPTLDAKRREYSREGLNTLLGLATLAIGLPGKDKKGVKFKRFDIISPPDIPMVILPFQGGNILGLRLDLDTGEITY